jgi:hypothetical protein
VITIAALAARIGETAMEAVASRNGESARQRNGDGASGERNGETATERRAKAAYAKE